MFPSQKAVSMVCGRQELPHTQKFWYYGNNKQMLISAGHQELGVSYNLVS